MMSSCCCDDACALDGGRLASRRAFVLALLGASTAACAAPGTARTPKEDVAHFPLIDVPSHYLPRAVTSFGVTPEELLAAMDAAGIKRVVVLGFGPEGSPGKLSLPRGVCRATARPPESRVRPLVEERRVCRPGRRLRDLPLHGLCGIDEGSERILFGVDFLAARHLPLAREIGDYYRGLLTRLTPATARKIGYENAQRLFGLG